MNAGPHLRAKRGLNLLVAHCSWSCEADAPSARERLDEAVGPELAHKLLLALCPPARREHAA